MVMFDTAEYELSHGRPRGRGLWMFAFNGDRGLLYAHLFQHNGTYSEAKKAVARRARDLFVRRGGNVWVKVMP